MAYEQTDRYFHIETPLGKDKLLLTRFNGQEELSSLFRFHLEMESEDRDLDFSKIVGKNVTVSIRLQDDKTRYINGVIGRFVQAGLRDRFAVYLAEVHPWLWLLTMSRDCRVFQNLSVPDIIKKVFGDLGQTDFKNSLSGAYQPREYCVQYNETAFDFISRLMEEEGICYFFEHEKGKHTLVLSDAGSAFKICEGAAKVQYGTFEHAVQQTVVAECSYEENVIPGAVALDDFNFETPSTDLMVSAASTKAQDGSNRRLFEYPGGFPKTAAGESRAEIRIVEQEMPITVLQGRSYAPAFTAGGKFTLEQHYADKVNGEYVLSSVSHSGDDDSYSNAFDGFPSDNVYRPRRTTPRPVIAGTQTAIVVGKKGEEIWTDKYGRIKVQFHWDQEGKNDEKSSCWVRVSHSWAGKSWGQVFLPRIGQEVIVSFEEGDPDRPLVTGRVYNAEQTVPYALPAEQTKSTIKSDSSKGGDGFNELRFEDKKESEEVFLQAEKDMNRVVKNNDTLKVGFEAKDKGDQTIDIYNDRTTTIDQGNETLTVKTGNRTIAVETGDETHTVEGKRDVNITKVETHNNKDDFNQNVDKNHTLKIKGDLLIDVTGSVTIKAGKSVLTQAGQGLTSKAGTALTSQAGTALTNKAGTSLTNKAGTTMTNDAGISLTNKGSASQTVDGGGALTLKGAIVKIN